MPVVIISLSPQELLMFILTNKWYETSISVLKISSSEFGGSDLGILYPNY